MIKRQASFVDDLFLSGQRRNTNRALWLYFKNPTEALEGVDDLIRAIPLSSEEIKHVSSKTLGKARDSQKLYQQRPTDPPGHKECLLEILVAFMDKIDDHHVQKG